MKRKHLILGALAAVLAAGTLRAVIGFPVTDHAVVASTLGSPSSSSALEAVIDQPGPLTVETVIGADWAVPRSGVINLKSPKAAALVDGDEPIVIQFHAIRHPSRGLFLIDTGVERALRDDPAHAAMNGLPARFMHLEKMKFHTDTAAWLAAQHEKPQGVFLTHLHLDHVSGMRDVPGGTAVYVGPGEASAKNALNYVVRPVTGRALEGKPPLREWKFARDPDGRFEGVLDVFGDGTLWALYVPGHTHGSVAFVARTVKGPVLFTGDACHTVWGWQHEVEPGTFSDDQEQSRESLARLESLVKRHPGIDVRLGHETLHAAGD